MWERKPQARVGYSSRLLEQPSMSPSSICVEIEFLKNYNFIHCWFGGDLPVSVPDTARMAARIAAKDLNNEHGEHFGIKHA